jgi:hypothetical protein
MNLRTGSALAALLFLTPAIVALWPLIGGSYILGMAFIACIGLGLALIYMLLTNHH